MTRKSSGTKRAKPYPPDLDQLADKSVELAVKARDWLREEGVESSGNPVVDGVHWLTATKQMSLRNGSLWNANVYRKLRRKEGPYSLAIDILGVIVFAHQSKVENGRLTKHFRGDQYYLSRIELEADRGESPQQISRAIGYLANEGIIVREHKQIAGDGFRKRIFVEPKLAKVAELFRRPEPTPCITSDPWPASPQAHGMNQQRRMACITGDSCHESTEAHIQDSFRMPFNDNNNLAAESGGGCGGKDIPPAAAGGSAPLTPTEPEDEPAAEADPDDYAQEQQEQARLFLRHAGKVYEHCFRRKISWTAKGRRLCYEFFLAWPNISIVVALYITYEAWKLTADELHKNHYFCGEARNPNQLFHEHKVTGELILEGAGEELGIDLADADEEECRLELRKAGLIT